MRVKSAAEIAAELFQDKSAPAPAAKTQKSNRRAVTPAERKDVSKPAIDELKKKIDASPAAPAKKAGRGRAKKISGESVTFSIKISKELDDAIRAYPKGIDCVRTILEHEFLNRK